MEKIIEEAVETWIKQGRDPEHIKGVRNFVTSKPFKDLLQQNNERIYRGILANGHITAEEFKEHYLNK